MSALTQVQLKQLKTRAHSLKPVVRVGQHGITAAVVRELDLALEHHELLKIKISAGGRDERAITIEKLCHKTHAECIQKIGGIAVLFRPKKEK